MLGCVIAVKSASYSHKKYYPTICFTCPHIMYIMYRIACGQTVQQHTPGMSFAEKQHCSRGLERQDGGPALAVFTSRGSTRFSTLFPFDTLCPATSVVAKQSDFMWESLPAVGWLCLGHTHSFHISTEEATQISGGKTKKSYIQKRGSLNSDQSRLPFLLLSSIVQTGLLEFQQAGKISPECQVFVFWRETAPPGEMVEILSCGR